jgi:predicted Zn-dependent peptidase
LSRKITGEAEEVEKIDRERLFAFYHGRIRGTNSVIAVAGNFRVEEARDLAMDLFPPGPAAEGGLPRTSPLVSRRISVVPDRFNQVQIYAGTCYGLDHDLGHYYTSLLFSTAFGESMSSRLFQRLREELALCYTVYSFRSFFSDTGLWTIYANATPALSEKLLGGLDAELARLARDPLSEKEISDAKSHLVGSMILSREDMETRMKRLVRQFTMMDRAMEFDESVAVIEKVSAADVEEFSRTYIRRDAFNLLVYGTRGLAKLRGFDFTFPDKHAGYRAAGGSAQRGNARSTAQRGNARSTAQK